MRAELAVVGVVDCDQRIDAGALGGIELVLLQFPSIRRQRAEIIAHHADRRLLEVDQLNTRHGLQDVLGGFDHALQSGMSMQGDAHLHGLAQKRPEPVEIAAQKEHERGHLEGLRAAGLLDRGQGRLGELYVTARAPRHHLSRLAARKLVHGVLGESARCGDVSGTHLYDAAAMARTAQHLIGDSERIHDVERKERNVRGLEHVAAGVEHEIGRCLGLGVAAWLLAQAREQFVPELHLRNMGHLARDLAEAVDPLTTSLRRFIPMSRHRDPRHAEHEARIDPVVAGLDAFAGEHAGIRPFARGLRAVAGAQDVDDAGDHSDGLGVHAAGAGDRADLDTLAAAGAGVRHRLNACGQSGLEGGGHTGTTFVRQIAPTLLSACWR